MASGDRGAFPVRGGGTGLGAVGSKVGPQTAHGTSGRVSVRGPARLIEARLRLRDPAVMAPGGGAAFVDATEASEAKKAADANVAVEANVAAKIRAAEEAPSSDESEDEYLKAAAEVAAKCEAAKERAAAKRPTSVRLRSRRVRPRRRGRLRRSTFP